ncbi:MAG: L-arabinose transport system permease protein [Halomonas sp. HL-48]|nr:L-arabinose ABC transporter permease AraH [Halomonas sp. HL-48]KPQ23303.1 MAG: L-arabinose transport system permease protein [Halomonas sp. HL-48]
MTTNNVTQGEENAVPGRPAGRQGLIKPLRTLLDTSGLIAIFLLLFVALAVLIPDFLTGRNMVGLLLSITLIGSLATTMMLVLALGEVDLSVASTVAFAGVVAAVVTSTTGSVFIGVIGGIVAGGAVGAFNGLVIAKFGINSLIATLAAMEFVRGLAYITAGGDAVMITVPAFFDLGSTAFLGLTLPVWTMLACFLIFGVVLNMTSFGRNVLATGGNSEAAALAGVNVRRLKIIVFGLQGVVAGVIGVLLASRMGLGDPNTSMGLELAVISACVLGGVALSGGVATITGVLVGVLIMGCVQNAMGLLNVPTFYQYLVRGAILLLAVMFDRWKQTRRQGT